MNVKPPPPLPDDPQETVIRCGCGWTGSVHALWATSGKKWPVEKAAHAGYPPGLAPPLPAASRIMHDCGAPETWTVPRTGRSDGMLAFACFWLGAVIIALFTVPLEDVADDYPIIPALVKIGFPLIGLGCLYAALRLRYIHHVLQLDDRHLSLMRSFAGFHKVRQLPREAITSVELLAFYQRNYEPVFGIEIRATAGKFRFGSALSDDDKLWLVHDLRRALGLNQPQPAEPLPSPVDPAIEESGSAVTLTLPRSKSSLVSGGLYLMVLMVGMNAFAMWGFSQEIGRDGTMSAFNKVGRAVFIIIPALLFCLGWGLWQSGRRRSRTVTLLHADAQGLTLEQHEAGGRVARRQWRRGEIEKIQVQRGNWGSQDPQWHGEIIAAGRVISFGKGCSREYLESVCAALRRFW